MEYSWFPVLNRITTLFLFFAFLKSIIQGFQDVIQILNKPHSSSAKFFQPVLPTDKWILSNGSSIQSWVTEHVGSDFSSSVPTCEAQSLSLIIMRTLS